MRLYHAIDETRAELNAARLAGKSIGFVPTMGCLHEGHLSLIRRARAENDFIVVSVFVNPMQFGANEDLAKYPRDMQGDLDLCAGAGVDLVFNPDAAAMYPDGFQTRVEVEALSQGLCGASRPGHFQGVATVVAKLLAVVLPGRAYFGEKDAQQLRVIRRMVLDLNLPVTIVPVPTVREPDGLAMSSRNVHLSGDERRAALALYNTLVLARNLVAGGERSATRIAARMEAVLIAEPLARLDYLAIVDDATLIPVEVIAGLTLVALAVFIGKTRLIDNMTVGP